MGVSTPMVTGGAPSTPCRTFIFDFRSFHLIPQMGDKAPPGGFCKDRQGRCDGDGGGQLAGASGDAASSPTGEAGRAAKPTGLIYL